jgi:hypothetical protein
VPREQRSTLAAPVGSSSGEAPIAAGASEGAQA